MKRVRRSDPDAAAHRERVVRGQLEGCRRIIGRIEEEGRLAAPWTAKRATDMLWALISDDLIEGLLEDRGWSTKALAKHLRAMLRARFLRPEGDTRA